MRLVRNPQRVSIGVAHFVLHVIVNCSTVAIVIPIGPIAKFISGCLKREG